jgi:hypothetical protein
MPSCSAWRYSALVSLAGIVVAGQEQFPAGALTTTVGTCEALWFRLAP